MGSPPNPQPDIEGFLCACLRGENLVWPYGQDDAAVDSFIELANYHGVLALLHGHLQNSQEAGHDWPPAVINACRESAVAHGMWELRHGVVLREVFSRLAAVGAIPITFKGTALAYTLYPIGALRNRCDTDLIIPPGTQEVVAATLAKLGFERGVGISGENVAFEASFTRHEPGSGPHTLDVHWRISNFELLSRLFSYEELLKNAQPMPALGPDALAVGPVHALMIACMHRAAHKRYFHEVDGVEYNTGNRLIWIYDIHLLANSFTADQWKEFEGMAQQKALCAVCLEGLELSRTCFHTVIPENIESALAKPGDTEKIARYFDASPVRQQWMDFCAIPGLASKLRFIAETVFPSSDYMRGKYPDGGWLPWLYLRRSIGGVFKRLHH